MINQKINFSTTIQPNINQVWSWNVKVEKWLKFGWQMVDFWLNCGWEVNFWLIIVTKSMIFQLISTLIFGSEINLCNKSNSWLKHLENPTHFKRYISANSAKRNGLRGIGTLHVITPWDIRQEVAIGLKPTLWGQVSKPSSIHILDSSPLNLSIFLNRSSFVQHILPKLTEKNNVVFFIAINNAIKID